MNIITLSTKDRYTYWAKKYSDSELLLKHLISERFVHGQDNLKDVIKLANAHS